MKFKLFLFIILLFPIVSCTKDKKEVEIKSPEVSNLHVVSRKENLVKLAWTNPPENEFKSIRVTCPDFSSAIELTKENNSVLITTPLNNVNYTITVKIIDNNQNESVGKMIVVKAANKQKKGSQWYISMTETNYINYYEYDSIGRLKYTRYEEYKHGILNNTYTYEYIYESLPDGGWKITCYQINYYFISCFIKYYDNNGNVIRSLQLSESGEVLDEKTYLYDENNRLKSENAEYNNFNDIISKKYNTSGHEVMTKYEYYPNRLLNNTKMYDDGVYINVSTTYEYDSIGNITNEAIDRMGDCYRINYFY